MLNFLQITPHTFPRLVKRRLLVRTLAAQLAGQAQKSDFWQRLFAGRS
jgi:hypothetical protein